jgi:UDP-GlcNAc:undecaprenyl-phosphate GlcNAc-1-phosphate transferase
MFMGFILAVLGLFAGAKIATTLLVMSVPIIDAIWVIFERWRAGTSIFSSDRRHLHFKLLELGWSQKMICFFYYVITALFAFIALNTQTWNKLIAIIVIGVAILLVFIATRKEISVSLK